MLPSTGNNNIIWDSDSQFLGFLPILKSPKSHKSHKSHLKNTNQSGGSYMWQLVSKPFMAYTINNLCKCIFKVSDPYVFALNGSD